MSAPINTTFITTRYDDLPKDEQSQSEYQWWEIWKEEWWMHQWSIERIIVITVIVIAVISICIIICYINIHCCRSRSRTKVKYSKTQKSDSEDEIIEIILKTVVSTNSNNNKAIEKESESESDFDSEQLYDANAAAAAPADAMNYTPGARKNTSGISQTLKDIPSVKNCLKAATLTIGAHASQKDVNDTKSTYIDGEGYDWHDWVKDTLQRCCPENWKDILYQFEKQKINEDVLISLNIDKQSKTDEWKELIPVIGDRIRFQNACGEIINVNTKSPICTKIMND